MIWSRNGFIPLWLIIRNNRIKSKYHKEKKWHGKPPVFSFWVELFIFPFFLPLAFHLSHSWVSSELCFFLPKEVTFPLAASPKRCKQLLGNLITFYFRITWELRLRVFHYYFVTHHQAGQLQTQMKRSFSLIFKSPWQDSDTHGARLSGSRCTELLYQEFLSKTVWTLWFYMLLELTIIKQVAEKKNKCYLLIPFQQ